MSNDMRGSSPVHTRIALPTIRTSRPVLRTIAPDDADALFRIFGDPELTRRTGPPSHHGRRGSAQRPGPPAGRAPELPQGGPPARALLATRRVAGRAPVWAAEARVGGRGGRVIADRRPAWLTHELLPYRLWTTGDGKLPRSTVRARSPYSVRERIGKVTCFASGVPI